MNNESKKVALADIRARLVRLAATYNVPVNENAKDEHLDPSRSFDDLSLVMVKVGTVTDEIGREAIALGATCYDSYLAFSNRQFYLKATGIPKKEFWASRDEFFRIVIDAGKLCSSILADVEPFKSSLSDTDRVELSREWDVFGRLKGARLDTAILQAHLVS